MTMPGHENWGLGPNSDHPKGVDPLRQYCPDTERLRRPMIGAQYEFDMLARLRISRTVLLAESAASPL
jgi:hypothetical protein